MINWVLSAVLQGWLCQRAHASSHVLSDDIKGYLFWEELQDQVQQRPPWGSAAPSDDGKGWLFSPALQGWL